jgi:hypothetical protein
VTYDVDSPTFDSFLFKYDPTDNVDCFYTGALSFYTGVLPRSKLQASGVFKSFKNSEVQEKTN